MDTDTAQLQRLIDREAIREVLYRFAEALDNRDWSLLRSLCQDEVDADYTAWGIPAQRMLADTFVRLFQQSFGRPDLRTQHLYTNFRIHSTSKQAQVVFNFLGQHYLAGFPEGDESFLHGEYTDTLQRDGDQWKLAAVKLRVFYTQGAIGMLAPDS